MDFKQHKLKGVITNDRENLYFVGFSNFVDHFHWLNDEDLEKLINDRDSAEAPSCPYKIQPENQVNLTQNSIAKLKKKTTCIPGYVWFISYFHLLVFVR